jgi:hypothetical protein
MEGVSMSDNEKKKPGLIKKAIKFGILKGL